MLCFTKESRCVLMDRKQKAHFTPGLYKDPFAMSNTLLAIFIFFHFLHTLEVYPPLTISICPMLLLIIMCIGLNGKWICMFCIILYCSILFGPIAFICTPDNSRSIFDETLSLRSKSVNEFKTQVEPPPLSVIWFYLFTSLLSLHNS